MSERSAHTPEAAAAGQRGDASTTLDRVAASAALTLYSLAVAAGFCRVFSGWTFFSDLFVVVVAGHVTGFVLRRVHIFVAVPVQILLTLWICAAVVYWDTFSLGLPNSTTWDLAGDDLSLVSEQFAQAVAPVLYAGGWTALAVIGVGLVVALADIFAFRAGARFEALVPGGVLFIVVGALGDGKAQVWTTIALVLAGILAASVIRSMQHRPARIVIGRPRPQRAALASTALALGAVTALAAGIIGPALPGAKSKAIYDTSNGPPEITRIESPLVDIRPRLVNQSASEMFSVRADSESYWRLASLGSFDGDRWRLDRAQLEGTGDIDLPGESRTVLSQEIVVTGLPSQLVPVAADPVRASGEDLRWSEGNSTLLVVGEDTLQPGDRIEAESALPRFTAEQLDAATSTDPPDGNRYVTLPDNLPEFVRDEARRITESEPNGYRKLLAIQSYFRNNFEYSLEVQQSSGNNAIMSFLRIRVGYCEQFAGTFAAMARSIGLPTRVAVGFTAGTYDDEAGVFRVAGRNSHAWPEVWFDGLGWVPFEPTPGRGIPGAEPYTGVAPQQDTGEVTPPDPGTGDPGGPATTIDATPNTIPPASVDEVPNAQPVGPEDTIPPVGAGGSGPDLNRIAWPALIVLGVGALLAASPAMIRRIRTRHLGSDPESSIVAIYERLRGLVTAAGSPMTASVTPREFARRAAQTVPGVRNDLTRLTDAVTASAFGPSGNIDPELVTRCEEWYSSIEGVAKTLLPWHVRLRRYFLLQ